MAHELLKMEFTTEEGARTNSMSPAMGTFSITTNDKTLNITGDHQHDLDGDYLQSIRFRRALKKQITTHDSDVKAVYNRVAADYGPDIKTIPPPDQKCPNFPGFRSQPWAVYMFFVGPVHTNF